MVTINTTRSEMIKAFKLALENTGQDHMCVYIDLQGEIAIYPKTHCFSDCFPLFNCDMYILDQNDLCPHDQGYDFEYVAEWLYNLSGIEFEADRWNDDLEDFEAVKLVINEGR